MITGAIKGTYRDRLYQELGLKYLVDRWWPCKFFFFLKFIQGFKTYNNAVGEEAYLTCSTTQNKIKPIPAKNKVSENLFFRIAVKNRVGSMTK